MWTISASQRHGDHMIGRNVYHGEHCWWCRVSRFGVSKVGHHHPVSRDLKCGPGRWTKRFLALEPEETLLTKTLRDRLYYTQVPFDGFDVAQSFRTLTENPGPRDIVMVITPYPIPGIPQHVVDTLVEKLTGHVIFIWSNEKRPKKSKHSYISFYSDGRKYDVPDISKEIVKAMGPHLRMSWLKLSDNLKLQLPHWRVDVYNSRGNDSKRTFAF